MPSWLLMLTLVGQMTVSPDGASVPSTPLFQDKGTPWVAPGRLFSVMVPKGWGVALHDGDPYTIDFRAVGRGGDAVVQIRRIRVPKGAHPRQLMMNAIERRLGKLPVFKVHQKRNTVVAGNRAASVLGTYAFQGNLQFPKVIEEVFVVVGAEAFIFHFECFEPAAGAYGGDLNILYSSFQPRPPGAGDRPFQAPEKDGVNQLDTNKIPF